MNGARRALANSAFSVLPAASIMSITTLQSGMSCVAIPLLWFSLMRSNVSSGIDPGGLDAFMQAIFPNVLCMNFHGLDKNNGGYKKSIASIFSN
ncbi:hypothetical protein [Xanthomonas arboricola]|uniref:hypothetical protein n=1 Tax=Xanthomonas arboricola TaxID=56448 RepID=UPI001187717D|nr:hypothetical protein [Xanthomonas arboricola]CAD7344527.1 hypothetical protein X12_000647 [Xanthomonas arboricola]